MRHWQKTIAALYITMVSALPGSSETIKVAMNGVADLETSAEYAFVVAFQEALTGSGLEVEVFPSNALGAEKERLGQTAQGLIQIRCSVCSTLAHSTAP